MPPRKSSMASKKTKSKLTMNSLDSYASDTSMKTPRPPAPSLLSQEMNAAKEFGRQLSPFAISPNFGHPGNVKGKTKFIPTIQRQNETIVDAQGETLWVDKYAPDKELDLAVHKKKVEEVRHWLQEAFEGGPAGVLRKYRRLLALTGHAGTGKTATLQVLAKEMNFEIIEWRNSFDDRFSTENDDYDRESLIQKFQTFLTRATACRALAKEFTSSSSLLEPSTFSRQVILLEDLPNVLHPATAEAFHAALEDYIASPGGAPLLFIVSDAGVRGENPESDISGRTWGGVGKEALDIRSIVPRTLFNSPYFREIKFNPIAPTLMTKALSSMMSRHFSLKPNSKHLTQPSKEVIQLIVESSNGDIRSAIMTLQFACIMKFSKGSKKREARAILEAVTRREQSLALFHLLGKVLYNKRKGDPHPQASTPKEREKIEKLDLIIPDPSPLPDHLAMHERRVSRVDIETLYADSPVDTSLFALYLHQNYTQFCNDIEECDSLCDWMSWIDSCGTEWGQPQQIPHQFHILALGALHSLPSPVSRRSQKLFKPEFFEALRKLREAEVGITETEEWLNTATKSGSSRSWSRNEIILECGTVLNGLGNHMSFPPPRGHTRFSALSFCHPSKMSKDSLRAEALEEDDHEEPHNNYIIPEDVSLNRTGSTVAGGEKSWLETDDIQEF